MTRMGIVAWSGLEGLAEHSLLSKSCCKVRYDWYGCLFLSLEYRDEHFDARTLDKFAYRLIRMLKLYG